MKRNFRLKGESDFNKVRRSGRTLTHSLFTLKILENSTDTCRVGIICSRMLGNAVQRNRIKRRFRAGLQNILARIKPGHDLIWITKKRIRDVEFTSLKDAITKTLINAGLI